MSVKLSFLISEMKGRAQGDTGIKCVSVSTILAWADQIKSFCEIIRKLGAVIPTFPSK